MRIDEVTYETMLEFAPQIDDTIGVSIGGNESQEMQVVEISTSMERYAHGYDMRCMVKLESVR